MRHYTKTTIRIFYFIFLSLSVFAQNNSVNSLQQLLKKANHDTTRCNILETLIEEEQDDAVWPLYNEELLKISETNLNKKLSKDIEKIFLKHKGEALNNKGYLEELRGNISIALEFHNKSLAIRNEIGFKKGIAESLSNIGIIHDDQGDIKKALEYFEKSLKIQEEIGEKSGIATSLNNIGYVYNLNNDVAKALEYYQRSLKIREQINDIRGIAESLNNIATVYSSKRNYAKALECLERSLDLLKNSDDKDYLATTLSNIGQNYSSTGNDDKAMEYHQKSLALRKEIGNKQGEAMGYFNIGNIYYRKQDWKNALLNAQKTFEISNEIGFPESINNASILLYKIYKATNKPIDALKMYELHIAMRDSLINQETKKSSLRSQFRYEYEKKAAADSVIVAEEKKVINAQLKQEKTQRFALYGGLSLVIVFAAFIFNRFRVTKKQKLIIEAKEQQTQKQNEIITLQKHLVEEKQKEIVDSINYAKRIQYTLLAHDSFLKEHLPEHFIFFKPKDIVSGDFYWATEKNNKFYLAVCDSTGHGVPGAFMSLLNITFLNEAINEKNIEQPNEVFNFVRQRLVESVSKEGQKDGFDGTMICIDKNKNQLTYTAANNSPILVRNKIITQLKGDRMPVSIAEKMQSFNLYTTELQTMDVIYLYTDGYADQFGGPKGKKFKYKQLNDLLLTNSGLEMPQQKEKLNQTFENWCGTLEQVDDVCIVGIKL